MTKNTEKKKIEISVDSQIDTQNVTEKDILKTTEKVEKKAVKKSVSDVKLTDRVPISNLKNWNLYFKSVENNKDITIPANANKWSRLTVAEIDGQVQNGNVMFVGKDGNGNNACIRIDDEAVYRYVFRLSDDDEISLKLLDLESIKKLIEIKDRQEYKNELNNLVVTNSDKKMISLLAISAGIENQEGYKKDLIEELIGFRF